MNIQRRNILTFVIAVSLFILISPIKNLIASTGPEDIQNLVGSWKTTLHQPDKSSVRLIVNIFQSTYGSLSATVDLPDAGPMNLPFRNIEFKKGKVVLKNVLVRGSNSFIVADYEGRLVGKNELKGSLYEPNGLRIPVTFLRMNGEELRYKIPRVNTSGRRELGYHYKIPEKTDDGWEVASMQENGFDTVG